LQKSHMTIQDIADAVGVSKATVSRYLNGKYNYMSEQTRWRIERVIQETGFQPNKLAGGLKTARTDLVGIVIPDASAMLTPFLISSICDECALNGRKPIVVSTNDSEDKERRLVRELLANQVDGIIVATGNNLDIYQEIAESGIPVVFTDRLPPNAALDTVVVDHYKSCQKAAKKLIENGYQRIVFMLRESKDGYGTFAPREESVRHVCSEANIRYEKLLVPDSSLGDFRSFQRAISHLYSNDAEVPTAVFVGEGLLMGHLICSFAQAGRTNGDEFAISGYDDTRIAATCAERFLVLNQPLMQMGTMATRILLGRIDGTVEKKEKIHCTLECTMTLP